MPRSAKPSGRRLGHRTAEPGPQACRVRPQPTIKIVDPADALSPRQRAIVEREARKLTLFYERIQNIRVTVTAPNRRLDGDVIRYQVHIHISVPREELEVERLEDASLLTNIQEAFKAARRVLQDHARRQPV